MSKTSWNWEIEVMSEPTSPYRISQQELVSDEINDFISRRPHWIVRFGYVIFILLLSGCVLVAGFIRYPEITYASATLFASVPEQKSGGGNAGYFAEIRIAGSDFKKIDTGQQVLLKFNSYPFEKYGIVKGYISSISANPSGEEYMAKVYLPDELNTTNSKRIPFKKGLDAKAEIITDHQSLLQHFIKTL